MTVRHASKLTRAQRRELHKQDRRTRQAKSRRMQHETLEARQLLASDLPQLISIQPNTGELIEENDIRGISPRELIFNFAEGITANDALDPTTLGKGIEIFRAGLDGKLGTGDDVKIVGPNANFEGFIGIGDKPNQVIVRFGEALPDDLYRIQITNALTDMEGDKAQAFTRNFELNLAPQVMSVVPQPVVRNETTGALEVKSNEIHVYFNDDDLDKSLAENPDYYQLSYQIPDGDGVGNNNDLGLQHGEVAFNPISVTYDPITDKAVLVFGDDIDQLIGSSDVASVFRLQIGAKGIASKTGQILDLNGQDIGSSFETAFSLSNFGKPAENGQPAEPGVLQSETGLEEYINANLFEGNHEFRVTRGALDLDLTTEEDEDDLAMDGVTFTIDDGDGNLLTFELTDGAVGSYAGTHIPIYLVTAGTTSVELANAIRDAINAQSGANFQVDVKVVPNHSPDRLQLRGTAGNRVSMILGDHAVGLIVDRSQSLVIRGEILNESPYNINLPGGNDEPGHRDIEIPGENHIDPLVGSDPDGNGVKIVTYNFPNVYGIDPASPTGEVFQNQITEKQKQRAREVFEIYAFYAGIEFVEVPSDVPANYGVVTGDLRAVDSDAPTGEGGVTGIAGLSAYGRMAIMETIDHDNPGDDERGAAWQITAFHEIGHLLGLDHSYDLPVGTVQGNEPETQQGLPAESLLPGDFDIVHLQHLHRPDSIDIDMYSFEVQETGKLSAEIVAERLSDASRLDSALTLYRRNGDGTYTAISRNDDYYSEDSFLEMTLEPGTYYIGVSASGNNVYDPNIEDSGFGGTSQGRYELQLRFSPDITDTISDQGATQSQFSSVVVQGTGADFTDGQTITLRDVDGTERTFEFDTDGSLTNTDHVAVEIQAGDLQSEVVAALVAAINDAEFDVTASSVGNRIDLANLAPNNPITLDPTVIAAKSLVVTRGAGEGASLDGDLDGTAGGTFNFWFRAEPIVGSTGLSINEPRTLFVDASYVPAIGVTPDGSLSNPFHTIAGAIAAAEIPTPDGKIRGDVIRVIGLQAGDDPTTLEDNIAYLIGTSPTGQILKDGANIILPKGVTMMIDEGAILKFSNTSIQVGSTTVTDDRSFASLQILGVPERYQPRFDASGNVVAGSIDSERQNRRVVLTSYRETTLLNDPDGERVGHASYTQSPAGPGNWGGILFNQEVDREQGRGSYEDAGIFLNSVIGADIRYAGGVVNIDGATVAMAPIYMEESRPTINYNLIHFSSGAALSADPNSFAEDIYTVFEGATASFTADITRVGPDIFGNRIVNNSTNGILVRIPSEQDAFGRPLEVLDVAARFDDTDIVYVIQEALHISATPGGTYSDNTDGIKVHNLDDIMPSGGLNHTLTIRANSDDVQNSQVRTLVIEFVTDASPSNFAGPANMLLTINLDELAAQGVFNEAELARRIVEAIEYFRDNQPFGVFLTIDVEETNGNISVTGDVQEIDTSTEGIALERIHHARFDGSLVVDPNVVVKFNFGRIEVETGANFVAEGAPGRPVVFTSLRDDRYGFGGTFDTNNDGAANAPFPGNWGGIYFSQGSHGSIDHAVIAYAGGESNVGGGQAHFNAVEIHQANVRLTNSLLEYNDNGEGTGAGGATRSGHMSNGDAVVFVRGAQPIIVGNNFRYNDANVLNVDTSSLNYELIVDWGRSTGNLDAQVGLADNQGALIRRNLLTDNARNAMLVRGGTLTTQSVWDDTDIVHYVADMIYSADFHTYGGIRLESSATESLVIKLDTDAGFEATGRQLDVDDRIGGMLHVIGQAGFPVIFTDLRDDSVGAGFTQNGTPQNDTNNDGNATTPAPGAWEGLIINQFANDRNVQVIVEAEGNNLTGTGINGSPTTSQSLGRLAQDEYSGSDNRRLGFEVNGFLSNPGDVDVYSFVAVPGTEVWFDIDRSSYFLDPIIELIDGNGNVLVASTNSFDQSGESFYGLASMLKVTNPLQKSGFYEEDIWSINPRDAGMRVVLPGNEGQARTYHIRIRSNSDNLTTVGGATEPGFTAGVYQLNIRLREVDEIAGSTIQFADIRYAKNGIAVYGQPGHSPLLGESAEDQNENNDSLVNAHKLGNVLNSDRAAISVAGKIADLAGQDVDWYEVGFNFDSIQNIGGFSDATQYGSLILDLDYAGGQNKGNMVVSVFDQNGQLIYVSDGSSVNDDLYHPQMKGPDGLTDLSRGSGSNGDAYLGTIMLPAGTPENPITYYVAVSSQDQVPFQMDQFFHANAQNTLVRFEPVNSVHRIVEDHLGDSGYSTPTAPTKQSIISDGSMRDFVLGDFMMFLSQDSGLNQTDIYAIDPFTGAVETKVGVLPREIRDLIMAPNGKLHAYGIDLIDFIRDSESGEFLTIDTGDGSIIESWDDGINTYVTLVAKDGTRTTVLDHIIDAKNTGSGIGWGIQFEGTTFHNNFSEDGLRLWAIGNRGNLSTGWAADATHKYANILFEMDASDSDGDGRKLGTLEDEWTGAQIGPGLENNAGYTNAKSFTGRVDTYFDYVTNLKNALRTTDATKANVLNNPIAILRDGMTFEVDLDGAGGDAPITFELDFGNDLVLNLNPTAHVYVKDGMSFEIEGSKTQDVIFQTGKVINLNGFDVDDIVEGASFQISDGVTTNEFVFDWVETGKSGNLPLTGTQIRIPYQSNFTAAKMSAAIADAVNNTAAALAVTASTAIGNRITFIGETSNSFIGWNPATFGNMTLEGSYGQVSDDDTIIVDMEEIWNGIQVTEAIRQAFVDAKADGFTDVVVSVNGVDSKGNGSANLNRFNFIEAGVSVAFTDHGNGFGDQLDTSFSASKGVSGTNIPVLIGAGYTAIDVANAIDASHGEASNVFETVETNVVYFNPDAVIDTDTSNPTPWDVGSEGSGGFVTGLAWIENDLFAVTDDGGLFNLTPGVSSTPQTNSEDVIIADYIGDISTINGFGLNLEFSSLTAGPANPGGNSDYSDVLFATTAGGDIYAFDADGVAQHVFQGNRSNISTGLGGGVNGLQFSTLNRNLWNLQNKLEGTSPGHGVNKSADNSRDAEEGGTSLYFGNTDKAFADNNSFGNATQYDYNFPGGAHGTVVSDSFSLYGYNAEDLPTLYFNYMLDTDGKDYQYNANEDDPARDALRVFIAGEDGEWHLIATNNTLRQADTGNNPDDEFDMIGAYSKNGIDESLREDRHLGTDGVQPMFDNTAWRQARIDLGAFAGQENLRIRFDFSTGGSVNLGGRQYSADVDLNTEELRFLGGRKIADGGTFTVTDYVNGNAPITFEFEKGQTLAFESGGRIRDGLHPQAPAGSNTFVLQETISGDVRTFEYVFNAADADPGNIPILISLSDTAADIMQATRVAILAEFGPTVQIFLEGDSSFNIQGVEDITDLALGMTVTGDNGVTPGNVAINYNSSFTNLQLATEAQLVMNTEMAPEALAQGYLMFDRHQEFIYGNGYSFNVLGSGLGHDKALQGDDFGYAHDKVGAPAALDTNSNQRGQDNLHTGAFIDDIIIGFRERGEMVTGASNGATGFTHNQQLREFETLTGSYQMEIRRGTDYGVLGESGKLIFDPLFEFDTNDRLTESYTIRTPSGQNLGTGDRLRIGDGTDWVTFEFFDLASISERQARGADGTNSRRDYDRARDIYSIGYFSTDSESEIAVRLMNAINDHAGQIQRQLISTTQGGLGVIAQVNSRTGTTTSNRVDLSRKTFADEVRVEYDLQSDDSFHEAFDIGIRGNDLPTTSVERTILGEIGDNQLADQIDGVADIDVYHFDVLAGQEARFALTGFNNLEATLKLFFLNNGVYTLVPNITSSTGGLGETIYEFTAASSGTYFAVVAGKPIPLPSNGGVAPATLNYDASLQPRKDVNRQVPTSEGHYFLEVSVANDLDTAAVGPAETFARWTFGSAAESNSLITLDGLLQPNFEIVRNDTYGLLGFKADGDSNRRRDQGQIILSSNFISYSENFGILIDAGLRDTPTDGDSANNRPHQGTPRNFPSAQNEDRLTTGVTISNNVIYDGGSGAIHYSGDDLSGSNPQAAVPFGRIINNTLYGTGTGDVGVLLDEGVAPTLLNNIVANFETGIEIVDATSKAGTEIIRTVFQGNGTNTVGTGLGNIPIELDVTDALFVDAPNKSFYLADGSKAIDAAVYRVLERLEMTSVYNPLGIEGSDLLAPTRDITGQLRVDDPTVTSTGGSGEFPFGDIGAFDRADYTGPTAHLIDPRDNDSEGQDLDAAPDVVQWISGPLTQISVQLLDHGQISNQVEGVGINDATVTANSVKLEIISGSTTTLLTQGIDYRMDYDATNNIIRLVPLSGVFQEGVLYKVTLDSDPTSEYVIRDGAGNPIGFNNLYEDAQGNEHGETRFLIQVGGLIDFGDAADSYGTTIGNDGARHNLVDNFYLGSKVDAEVDGQPSLNADAEGNTDDGILIRTPDPNNPGSFLNFTLRNKVSNQITITVTVPDGSTTYGFVDAWVDFNQDGIFDPESERILESVALNSSALNGQTFTITSLPDDALEGVTTARFRFSSTGGLAPIGLAEDGEVEDYQVIIGPAGRNPWHNAAKPPAVSLGDNIVTGLDLSLLLRELRDRVYTYSSTEVLPPGKFVGDFRPGYEPETVDELLVTARLDVDGDGRVTNQDRIKLLDYMASPTVNPEPLAQDLFTDSMLGSQPTVVESSGLVQVESHEITSPVSAGSLATESLASSLSVSASNGLVSSFDAMSASYSDLQMRSAVELMGYTRAGGVEQTSVDVSFIDEAIALDGITNQDQLEQLLGDMAGDLSSAWDGKQLGDDAEEASNDDDLDDVLALLGDGSWDE